MPDELVTLMVCAQAHEAHVLCGVLQGEGIEAVIADEHLSGLYGHALGGVRLQVRDRDRARARALLASLELPPDQDPE
jgi:Putative prokaryotic signal transducing protein